MHDTLEARSSVTDDMGLAFDGVLFELRAAVRGADTDVKKAQLCGISRSTLNRIRRGTTAPTLATAMRMARALDLSVDRLFPGLDRQQ